MVRAHFASDSHSLPNVMYESLLEYIHWIIYAISVLSPWPRVLFESLPFVLRGRREWACYATQPARESRQSFDPRRERIGDISLANFGNAGRDKVKLHFANDYIHYYYYYYSIISIIPWSTRWDRTIGVLWKSRWDTFWDPPPGGLIRPWCCDYRTRRRHKLHNRIWRLKGRAEKKEEEGTNLQVVFLFSFLLGRWQTVLFSHFFGQGEWWMIDDSRIRVGHSKDHGDASGKSSGRTRGEIFLVNCAWIAGVYVNIDQAGKFNHRPRRHAIRMSFHSRCTSAEHSHSLRNRMRIYCDVSSR